MLFAIHRVEWLNCLNSLARASNQRKECGPLDDVDAAMAQKKLGFT